MLVSASRERGEGSRGIYRSAMRLFFFMGLAGSTLMFILARPICASIKNENALYCIIAISPALLFVCISSAVRGFFQGFGYMTPTAVSQLIEAVGKLVLGILFARYALTKGYDIPTVAAFAVAGLMLGTLVSALYLLIIKKSKSGFSAAGIEKNEGGVAKTLLRIAFPITVGAAVLGITKIVDMTLIMRRLQDIGFSPTDANEIYGSYTTLAVRIFSLIPSLLTPISLALVPQLAAAVEKRSSEEQSEVVANSIRLTVLCAMPATLGISVYAREITSLLFPNEKEAITIAAPLLSILGASILFACLITTSNAVLQSYRKTVKPIVSTVIGASVKIVAAYIMIGIPGLGVYGAPISTFLCNLTITVLNIFFILKLVPKNESIAKIYLKPFFASALAILVSVAVYLPAFYLIGGVSIPLVLAILSAAAAYVVFALLFGIFTKSDALMLPKGEKLVAFYERLSVKKKEKKIKTN